MEFKQRSFDSFIEQKTSRDTLITKVVASRGHMTGGPWRHHATNLNEWQDRGAAYDAAMVIK